MLRVIGLLFVVAYHLYPSALRGGFIGVDIFFVCSGYLMTAHIINEYGAKSRVKLAASYTRRFKRLFPALAGAVLFGMALSLFISPDFRVDIGRQALAAAAAFTNYYEILTGGSYENQLLPHLFVHTWALAVEIQFYAVWGAILAAVVWLNRKSPDRGRAAKTAFAAALVLGALSYLVMRLYYSGGGDPARAYYAFESRAFSLLAGAAAGAIAGASAPRRQKESAPRRRFVPAACAAAALSVAGLAVLAVRLRYNEPETYSFGLLL
ncbi:MAG: acyltransferase, partial [Firmicutes bacterium]|nr:acyltransferase [Bacillota bacterium]